MNFLAIVVALFSEATSGGDNGRYSNWITVPAAVLVLPILVTLEIIEPSEI